MGLDSAYVESYKWIMKDDLFKEYIYVQTN
uniref:Uncharacterized protein n=1 Tax=Siphoviridae sp. ctINK4 TaxID=2825428 RepID=A0A8S5NX52_9CAUD|nr:MAG TPA: hypothetical protein [Siphoviridae sp. ctINK4]